MRTRRNHLQTLKSRPYRKHLQEKITISAAMKRRLSKRHIVNTPKLQSLRMLKRKKIYSQHGLIFVLKQMVKTMREVNVTFKIPLANFAFFSATLSASRRLDFTWVSTPKRVYWGTSRRRRVAPCFTSSKAVSGSMAANWKNSRSYFSNLVSSFC